MINEWKCARCATRDMSLRYPSGKMKKCMDCQRFYNISVNAKKERVHKPSPKLSITEGQFVAWCRSQERKCFYCKIDEKRIGSMGLKTQTGRPLSALGVDRIDSSLGYEEDNIVLCCFACNKAKGDVFTHKEMVHIGKSISHTWDGRKKND